MIRIRYFQNGGLANIRAFYFAYKGLRKYIDIKKKYGENAFVYINHYPGTGDVYITSMYIEAWVKKNNTLNPVITVIGKGAYKITQLFRLHNVELLEQSESDALIKFYQIMGGCIELDMEVLHYDAIAMHCGILDCLPGVHHMNFINMYDEIVFPGLGKSDRKKPIFSKDDGYIKNIFKDNNLIPSKTILLCPYANTIDPLSEQFWRYLVNGLKSKGYTVVTNVSCEEEAPIEGTKGVFILYKNLKQFLETAGTVIMLRSGLAELISSFECRKIILYPIENRAQFGIASLYDYFSLNKMELCNDAEEYEFNRSQERVLYERIIDSLN